MDVWVCNDNHTKGQIMIRSNNTSTAVGYVRRSTDRQEQSINDQKNILVKYAEEQGIRLNKFYIDDAISGTYTLKRKAFLQMISDAERPSRKFDSIIVYDIKRFGRVDNDEAGYYYAPEGSSSILRAESRYFTGELEILWGVMV
jgi:hypothetical protein